MDFETKTSSEKPNEKEVKLDEIRDRVEKIADGLGLGIDDGIKESVVAVMANEFPTSGSCKGHLIDKKNNRPFLYPSVDIEEPEPEGWRDDEELQRQWSEANVLQQTRMQELLDEFYTNKSTDEKYRLVINPRGIFNASVLASARCKEKPGEDEAEVLARARQEMDNFTKFLMKKYQETE
jgi:hypothetical protein